MTGPPLSPQRRVTFDDTPPTIIDDGKSPDRNEQKAMWYGESELADFRQDSRGTVFVMRLAEKTSMTIDPSLFCVVGLEKFCNWRERDRARKLLIKSVIDRQRINKTMGQSHETHSIRCVSESISRAFADIALWQAALQESHAYAWPIRQFPKVMKRRTMKRSATDRAQGLGTVADPAN